MLALRIPAGPLGALVLAAIPVLGAAATPSPDQVKHLQQRLQMMLTDIGHKNEQTEVSLAPDATGMRTIVRIRVHPSVAGDLRTDLTKHVNEYIAIHRGDCRANTSMRVPHAMALVPIRNGVSQTNVDVPISTLLGHGNVVTTHTADGTVINCGAL